MLYPKCCPVEFSSVSLMDNQNPQGPGYAQKSVRFGEKKKKLILIIPAPWDEESK